MGHFAKVLDGKVVTVIVAEPEFMLTFVDTTPGTWLQASYNTRGGVHYAPNSDTPDDGAPLRKNFPGPGWTYDDARDAFIPPQPYPSWLLDEDSCLWHAPTPFPESGYWIWDESTLSWVPAPDAAV